MALSTYTCTTWTNSPKAVEIGNSSVSGQVVWTATSTVGDVALLAKIPHGATIIDIIEDHSTGAAAQALSFGLDRGAVAGGGGNSSCFIASGAQATVNRKNVVGLPITVSVSDNDTNRWASLTAKVESGTTTTSLVVNFTIVYRTDGT
jgi:hypothetical protein